MVVDSLMIALIPNRYVNDSSLFREVEITLRLTRVNQSDLVELRRVVPDQSFKPETLTKN